ncbi:MAG: hypothetical protein IH983_12330 [Planctomycetes bacterium]|nr:hypothetical protein [Planctomycetota bacterium]
MRLIEGITPHRLDELLAAGRRGPGRAAAIDRHVGEGLLQRDDGSLRLTRRGLLLADIVLADLL